MAFIPAPQCVEAILRFVFVGQTVTLTLSFCKNTPPSVADLTTLANTLADWYDPALRQFQGNVITLESIKVTDLTTASSPTVEVTVGQAGLILTAVEAPNVAIVTTLRTAQRGRSFRGRSYLFGTAQAQRANSGSVTAAQASAIAAAYATLPAAVLPFGWTHVVISRFTNNAPRVTALSTPVVSYSTDVNYDSQRRRLIGRGQ